MPGIYIAALITSVVTAAAWGGVFAFLARERRRLIYFAAVALPLSAFVNVWVKQPLALGFLRLTGAPLVISRWSPWWLLLFMFLLAPLTEEAIKLLPFMFSGWRRELKDRGAALWAGSFAGLGFGIGEIWFLAWTVARVPAYTGLRFWEFGGFFGERLLATYAHAVLTAVAVSGLAAGRRQAARGYLSAVGLHGLVNLGAMLYQLGLIGAWAAQLGLLAAIIVLTVIFEKLVAAARRGSPRNEATLYERDSEHGQRRENGQPEENRDPV